MAGDLKGKEDEKLPPGFRFHPTDEELITYYLINKMNDSNFTERAVADVDLNKCEPWDLPGKAKMGVKEWYFFSLRDRKYPTGVRTNRATNSGYWKTTGKDREIYNSQTLELVGMKKTLVFYRGRAPRGEKTNWVMHEYRIHAKSSYRTTAIAAAKQDEWVVCRVIQKSGGVKKYTSSSSHSRAMNPYNLEIGQSHSQLMMMQQQQQQQQQEADHAYHQLQTMGRNYMMSQSEMEQLSRVFRVGVGIGGTNGLNLPIHNNSQLNYSHHLGNGAEAAAFTISGLNLNLSGGGGGANMAPPAPIPPPPGINNQHVVGSSMLTSGGIANEGAGGGGGYVPTADQQINNTNAMNDRSYEGVIQCADLDAYWAAY